MAHALASKPKTSLDIFKLKVGILVYNLFRSHAVGEQLQNVTYPNPHSPDAGPATTLLWVDSDSFKDLHHTLTSKPCNLTQLKRLRYLFIFERLGSVSLILPHGFDGCVEPLARVLDIGLVGNHSGFDGGTPAIFH
jgi:hypothetical protein